MAEAVGLVVGGAGFGLLLCAWYVHRKPWMGLGALTLALATGFYAFLLLTVQVSL